MKVVFLNRFYLPDVAATGQLLAELAEDLAGTGIEVTVITGSSSYLGAGKGGASPLPESAVDYPVRVRRVRGTGFDRRRTAGRLINYAVFFAGCGLRALLEEADVVVAMTDPPLLSVLGAVRKRIRGGKLVLWMQDVFPDLARRFGVIDTAWLGGPLSKAAAAGYASADAVIALGEAMEEHLHGSGVPREKLATIHNWADGRLLYSAPAWGERIREEKGWMGKFIVLYSGNMGRVHDFSAVMEAMRELSADPRILFLFAGEGAKKVELEAFVRREGIRNVAFAGYAKKSALNASLNVASAFLVTQDARSLGLIVPSKIYSSLAVGRPILAVGPRTSELDRILSDSRAGFFHEPGDSMGLAESIRRLADSPKLADGMGEMGRRYFLARFDRKVQTGRFRMLLTATSP
jgi:glycosyltransferase involved in cell wall biosynthesis